MLFLTLQLNLIPAMRFFRILLIFLLIFIRCNTTDIISREFNLELPEEVVIPPPMSAERMEHIETLVQRVLDNHRFNGNVLIAFKGYPIVKISRGYSNIFTKKPMNFETVFQLASVSKAFTAMSVLMLHERGKLHIEEPVQNYIPEFPFEEITIKHLLQHTSGLQNYMYFVDNYWDKEKSLTYDDVLTLLKEHNSGLGFTPGRRHHYSNTGYAMLAMLVERVSNMPFHQFVKQHIFDPVGMDHSFVWNKTTIDTSSNVAFGFVRRGRRYSKFDHDPLDEIGGDKSVYSTMDDLLKWEQAWSNNLLISDSLTKIAFTKVITPRNRFHDYGMGWRFMVVDDKQVIYHNGLWNGFTTSLTRYIEDSVTIILLNNVNAPAASIVKQLYNTIKDEVIEEPFKVNQKDDPIASLSSGRGL
ncbi:MAG: beta-lactamase family protein [Bacteroidales bacterium]|nr:beta-lactamase family protein [Bacteroidales bacterium]